MDCCISYIGVIDMTVFHRVKLLEKMYLECLHENAGLKMARKGTRDFHDKLVEQVKEQQKEIKMLKEQLKFKGD